MTEELRVIKKYPNRRLYDTAISRYITLDDIKQLVKENVNFKVIDARSEEDLTNNTLLQIILEQEGSESPIFTREILQNVIRFYGDSMQSFMSNYLEESMAFFLEQQREFKHGFNAVLGGNPLSMWTQVADRNMAFWKSMQEAFLNTVGGGKTANTVTENNSNDTKK